MRQITESLIQEIRDKIVKNVSPLKIILFGSYAYGGPRKGSDIDLLIVKHSNLPRRKRTKEIRHLFRDYFISMDIIVYTPEEIERFKDVKSAFVRTVLKKGRVLYG
ncbi:nucleotidyltransferase domain-containing protein [candidate division WOR-3 bacterium]|nr:nucleotidyltransferase domain-containing protein [candidate division WOR-3 bacterium]